MARIVVLLLLMLTVTSSPALAVITRLSDGKIVAASELMESVASSDVVLIGESHDNKFHHDMQLAVIRSLWARKLPLAIGLEMMQTDSQPQLDQWTEGRIDEQIFRSVFTANWSDWDMYRDIFLFARDHHIPMVALNIRRDIVSKVAHQGFASLSAEEKKDLPQGTTCDLNNPHTEFLKRTFEGVASHTLGGKMFTYFCEAQTLRNSSMALTIVRYLSRHPRTKLVGLTGVWHAVKNAIPEQVEHSGSHLAFLVILPEIPEMPAETIEKNSADYLIGL